MVKTDFLNRPGFVWRPDVKWKTLGCGRHEFVSGVWPRTTSTEPILIALSLFPWSGEIALTTTHPKTG